MQKHTTYFTMDAESVEAYGDVSGSSEWGLEDITTSKEPSRASQICSGPRLIPKIRMQDQALEAREFLDYGFNAGIRPSNINASLQRHVDPGTTTTSSRLTLENGMYHSLAQGNSPEQSQKITSYSPMEFASSDVWQPASEDYCNSSPSTSGPYSRLPDGLTNGPYVVPSGQFSSYVPDPSDQRNSPWARKSFEAVPSVKAIDPSMFPSSLPKGKRSLARTSRQCSNQTPLSSIAGQNHHSIKKTSLLAYLGLPNPALSLVERIVEPGPSRDKHFFFDVRNVRSWSDFSVESMLGVPELKSLLDREVPCDTLSIPRPVGTSPATREQLHLAYRDHFGVKLNAALKSSLAQSTLQMHSNTGDNTLMLPDFTSTVSKSQERIRVVGIVLCYEQWRSDMRHGNPSEQVRYLSGLARLQHFFREHGCRYGFIITEIELVCVRYGGDDMIYASKRSESSPSFTEISSSAPIPIFGYLEVSNAIALSEQHTRNSKDLTMTAGLALWYLHMQACDEPLPGHQHWKLEVGKPSAMTRKKHLVRDAGMPKPVFVETRRAKRIRGWIWPNEEFSKKESGKGRRSILRK
ncbi:hypothetical protein KCU65_g3455, partial [Aureobasidium melanogenum]